MFVLIFIGVLGGLITAISPCILPVLPVVFAAGTVAGVDGTRAVRRPLLIVAGLVLSFSVFTLVGSWLLSALGLPQDLLRDIGIVVLVIVATGLIVPSVGELIERPFARIAKGRVHNEGGGFVLGVSLGLLYVPCAGPVLAAITVVGASHRIGLGAVVLTVAFAVGTAIPLLVFAFAGQHLATRVAAVRTRALLTRRIAGVVLVVTAAAIAFNLTDALQRDVPGYATALQNHIDSSGLATGALAGVTGNHTIDHSDGRSGDSTCAADVDHLVDCGAAPKIVGIASWLNTSGNRPLTVAGLRGHVVLVDFWTYSCINCQRTLPHLAAWNRAYRNDGLDIIGVHTPEFAFEHVRGNVAASAKKLGVSWPIALDNDYATWDAYGNQYWPAEYLIDATGKIRHVSFGEGGYDETEKLIRTLLKDAHANDKLGAATKVVDRTPTGMQTPESYLGYERIIGDRSQTIHHDADANYTLPDQVDQDAFAFRGHWTIGAQQATAGRDASLDLRYQASDVYLVLSGTGTVGATVDGRAEQPVRIGGAPSLYTLVDTPASQRALLHLTFSPGVQAYAFTFG